MKQIKTINLNRKEVEQLLMPQNLLHFNRSISLKHATTLAKSIDEIGMLRLPIIGDLSKIPNQKSKSIIDGQHLLKGFLLNKRNKNISCLVKKYETKQQLINDISLLNSTQKRWKDEDYLDAWCEFGPDNVKYYHNYSDLRNFYNQVYKGLTIGTLLSIWAKDKKEFKLGRLTFNDRSLSKNISELCYILKTRFNKSSYAQDGVVKEMQTRKYDYIKLKARLITSLNNNEDKGMKAREEFREFIRMVYNRI